MALQIGSVSVRWQDASNSEQQLAVKDTLAPNKELGRAGKGSGEPDWDAAARSSTANATSSADKGWAFDNLAWDQVPAVLGSAVHRLEEDLALVCCRLYGKDDARAERQDGGIEHHSVRGA